MSSTIPTYTAITGRLAQACRDAIDKTLGPTPRVWLVREHRCGLTPKMWQNEKGEWVAINGGSLLAPEWSIARHLRQIEVDLNTASKDSVPLGSDLDGTQFSGLICIDSEAYFPRLEDTRLDARPQHEKLLEHSKMNLREFDGAAQHALTTYFTSFVDQVKLCRPKARVGLYGLPTWRDGSLTDAVERRVDVTFPCCYTGNGDAYETAADRVYRAKHEAPTKPCIAFVCPFREVAGLPPLAALEFSEQCRGARDGGADGLCVWWDADDTTGLTKLLGQLSVIKAGMGATT